MDDTDTLPCALGAQINRVSLYVIRELKNHDDDRK